VRVFAVLDIHIDYDSNREWLGALSVTDYRDDLLILGGDVSDSLQRLEWCLKTLVKRFRKVLFVPGNHELWVIRDAPDRQSLEKFQRVNNAVENSGAIMNVFHCGSLSVVPLLAWNDYSLGEPRRTRWMDYYACRRPGEFEPSNITSHFLPMNEPALTAHNTTVISFSHFLPRVDLMPAFIPTNKKVLYPVLGTHRLETQIKRLMPDIQVYGHCHVNRKVNIDGVSYVNNAFGYSHETRTRCGTPFVYMKLKHTICAVP
jgi:Icc-related predicted phosphoesterase